MATLTLVSSLEAPAPTVSRPARWKGSLEERLAQARQEVERIATGVAYLDWMQKNQQASWYAFR